MCLLLEKCRHWNSWKCGVSAVLIKASALRLAGQATCIEFEDFVDLIVLF